MNGLTKDADNMTDDQWAALIELFDADAESQVDFPPEPGALMVIRRGGLRTSVAADGERKDWP